MRPKLSSVPDNGTAGQVLTKTSTGHQWQDAGTSAPAPDASLGSTLREDFVSQVVGGWSTNGPVTGLMGTFLSTGANGSGTQVPYISAGNLNQTGNERFVGTGVLCTGDYSATGQGCGFTFTSYTRFGLGRVRFRTSLLLPTVASGQRVYAGLMRSTQNGGEPGDGVFFRFEPSVSANIKAVCRLNGTTVTEVDTGMGWAAAQAYQLYIDINAAGTQALFYVNGVLKATITTNIPPAATDSFLCGGVSFGRSTASTSYNLLMDYIEMITDWTR